MVWVVISWKNSKMKVNGLIYALYYEVYFAKCN